MVPLPVMSPMSAEVGATALIIPVPAADAVVGPWRARFDPAAGQGVPAHITVLYPFLPLSGCGVSVRARLGGIFAGRDPFRFALVRVARTGRLSYLEPDPGGPIVDLTGDVVRAWPGCLPYRGRYGPKPRPHVTIGYPPRGTRAGPTDADHAAMVAEIQGRLPLAGVAAAVELWTREGTMWRSVQRFPLGSAPPSPGDEGQDEPAHQSDRVP